MQRRARRPLRILMSAGPTREPLDPVRFLSNYSTGYMGAQLATEALARGHRVTVVSGPIAEPLPPRARTIHVERAGEMERALHRLAGRADAIIMAAAVCDFRPARPSPTKLPRRAHLTLKLEATPDLLAGLPRRPGQVVAGFSVESGAVVSRAMRKLRRKRLDLLLAQRAGGRSPFGRRPVQAWLLARGGEAKRLGTISKPAVARLLLDKIETLWYGQQRPKVESKLQKAQRRGEAD